jgi:hypothetical protein
VSNAFGSITTQLDVWSTVAELEFQLTNFDAVEKRFRVVITADLAIGNDTRPDVFTLGYNVRFGGGGYDFEWYGTTGRVGEYYPELGTVNDSLQFGDEMLLTGRDSAMWLETTYDVPPFASRVTWMYVYSGFQGDPMIFEVREVELPSRVFSTSDGHPVLYRVHGVRGHSCRLYTRLSLGNVSQILNQENYVLESDVVDRFTYCWLLAPHYGNWSLQFFLFNDEAGRLVADPKIYYFNYLSPDQAKGTPRPTVEEFTESFTRQKFRIRQIFQYAYIIPTLVN